MTGAGIRQYAVIMQERSDSADIQGQNMSETPRIGLHNEHYGACINFTTVESELSIVMGSLWARLSLFIILRCVARPGRN